MDKTKKIILKEGFNSVIRNGIRSFTVESLASSLSMSKKTIYSYFPKKEILIKKIIDFRMKKLSNEFREIIQSQDDAIVQFIEVRNHHIKFANKLNLKKLTYIKARHPHIWEIIEQHRLDRKAIYMEIFKLAKSQSYLRSNLEPSTCASIYMNVINSTFQPDFLNNNELELNETIDHLRKILSYGFFNDKAINKMKKYGG
ncbi:MAG: hypothetical protein CMG26_03215 [Candidatus Marinimicrobia bacterium]|nr:hypothetical protein [Candidatus Neomarinimicrobiota bacterium]